MYLYRGVVFPNKSLLNKRRGQLMELPRESMEVPIIFLSRSDYFHTGEILNIFMTQE